MMESGELVVRYRARRTYSRRTTEATREFPSLPLHVTQKDDTLDASDCPYSSKRYYVTQHARTCLCPEERQRYKASPLVPPGGLDPIAPCKEMFDCTQWQSYSPHSQLGMVDLVD